MQYKFFICNTSGWVGRWVVSSHLSTYPPTHLHLPSKIPSPALFAPPSVTSRSTFIHTVLGSSLSSTSLVNFGPSDCIDLRIPSLELATLGQPRINLISLQFLTTHICDLLSVTCSPQCKPSSFLYQATYFQYSTCDMSYHSFFFDSSSRKWHYYPSADGTGNLGIFLILLSHSYLTWINRACKFFFLNKKLHVLRLLIPRLCPTDPLTPEAFHCFSLLVLSELLYAIHWAREKNLFRAAG